MALMPQDPAKQKQLLLALVPLLLAFGFYYFVHTPRMEEVETLESRLLELEHKNNAARIVADRSGPELEQRLAIFEQHISRLEQLIPTREEVPGLLNSVTARAQQAGVELNQYRPIGEEQGDHYSRQIYEISVLGGFHSIGSVLAEVGSLPRIITPTSLTLALRPDAETRDGDQMLLASFRIETYVLPGSDSIPVDLELSEAN
jgi:type IV pilus assembly protein PilO